MNVRPGQRFVWAISGPIRSGDAAEVLAPTLRRWPARLSRRRDGWTATYDHTAVAGMYRLILPDAALGPLATRPAVAATDDDAAAGVPFVVLDDPDESRLELLAEADFERAKQFLDIRRARTLSELVHAIAGGVPGGEIWKLIAVLCAALLAAEIALTRLIAVRRQVHLARPVAFGTDQVDADTFRDEARRMLEVPAPESKEKTAS
jgi:hypothetical protein